MAGRVRLKYIDSVKVKGRRYYYFRHRRKGIAERIHGEPGSSEFMAHYTELLASVETRPRIQRHTHGTIDWLVCEYQAHPKFTRLGAKTREGYGRMLNAFQPIGRFQVGDIQRKHVQELRRQFHDRPRTADEFAKVASILFAFAVDQGLVDRNPAERLGKLNAAKSYEPWAPAECAAFEASQPPQHALTAYMLALYTGQRRGDVLRMTWAAYDGLHIAVRQSKTGSPLKIRAHARLKAHLDAMPRDSLLMVTTARGSGWDESAFSKEFRRALNAAGLNHLHFHGLRHTAAKRLAEAGCTAHEIQAITGHKSLQMVERYTREVNQGLLSDAAVTKLEIARKTAPDE